MSDSPRRPSPSSRERPVLRARGPRSSTSVRPSRSTELLQALGQSGISSNRSSSPQSFATAAPGQQQSLDSIVEAKSIYVKPLPTKITPPPPLCFDSQPVAWKGLSLEAATWTWSSDQLQEVVSRAIRASARESFVRLLSVEALDRGLVSQSEHLATLKAVTTSRYRFNVHRRTMLLQALMSFATAASGGGTEVVASLALQLSEITVGCDRLMEELLRITDQQAQIAKLQDVHCSSALAIAIRKLNSSYAKRTTQLKSCQERIEVLEREVADAWRAAEKMAEEIDQEEEEADGGSMMAETVLLDVTGTAVSTRAQLADLSVDSTDSRARTLSVRSGRSDTNRKSRSSTISAAKKRSSRASSLHRRTGSRSRPSSVSDDMMLLHPPPPPVPNVPNRFHGPRLSRTDLDFKPPMERERPASSPGMQRSGIPSIWIQSDLPPSRPSIDRVQSMVPMPRRHSSDIPSSPIASTSTTVTSRIPEGIAETSAEDLEMPSFDQQDRSYAETADISSDLERDYSPSPPLSQAHTPPPLSAVRNVRSRFHEEFTPPPASAKNSALVVVEPRSIPLPASPIRDEFRQLPAGTSTSGKSAGGQRGSEYSKLLRSLTEYSSRGKSRGKTTMFMDDMGRPLGKELFLTSDGAMSASKPRSR